MQTRKYMCFSIDGVPSNIDGRLIESEGEF